jgi:hypothetical protein
MTTCTKPFKTRGFRDLAKVDLIHSTHALERRGLFENVEMKMERTVATKKLAKIIGKGFGWRIDPKAPSAEEREQAKANLKTANAIREELRIKMEARRRALLEDAEYQELLEDLARARKHADHLLSKSHHYKITVGKNLAGLFFSVMAQGDSWEDVIDQLTKKKAA